jgi:hypothetical protein
MEINNQQKKEGEMNMFEKKVFIIKYKNHSIYYQSGEKNGFLVDKPKPGEAVKLFSSEAEARNEINRLIEVESVNKEAVKKKRNEEARLLEIADQDKRLEETIWTVKLTDFKGLINMISPFSSEAVIKYEDKRLNVVAMDPANVALLSAGIAASQKINDKNSECKTRIGINMNNVAEIINKINGVQESLIISFQKELKKIRMLFSDGEIIVPLIELEEEKNVPELKFDAKKTIDYSSFEKIMLLANATSASVTFQSEKNFFKIKASDGISSFSMTKGKTVGKDSKAKYSTEYIKKYLPTTKKITLLWSTDYPLKIVDEKKNYIIIAPRIDNN